MGGATPEIAVDQTDNVGDVDGIRAVGIAAKHQVRYRGRAKMQLIRQSDRARIVGRDRQSPGVEILFFNY